MKNFMMKLTSRKFIVSVTGILSGIITIASGNTAEGVTVMLTSIVAYLITEGYIDAKALDIADAVVEETKEKLENQGDVE